jgi:hypothetical protein
MSSGNTVYYRTMDDIIDSWNYAIVVCHKVVIILSME